MLKDISETDGQIILLIDEPHTLVGVGAAEGAMDASNVGRGNPAGRNTTQGFRQNSGRKCGGISDGC